MSDPMFAIQSIEATNIGPISHKALDLMKPITVINWPQNSGKTTLMFDVPMWVLFGKTRNTLQSMHRIGSTGPMSGEVTFLGPDSQSYTMIRIWTPGGKTTGGLFRNEKDGSRSVIASTDVPGTGIEAVESELEVLLPGMNADLAKLTVFAEQGATHLLCSSEASKVRTAFASLVGLGDFPEWGSKARVIHRGLKAQAAGYKEALPNILSDKARLDLMEQIATAENLRNALNAEIGKLDTMLRPYQSRTEVREAQKAKYEKLKAHRDGLEKRLREMHEQIASVPDIHPADSIDEAAIKAEVDAAEARMNALSSSGPADLTKLDEDIENAVLAVAKKTEELAVEREEIEAVPKIKSCDKCPMYHAAALRFTLREQAKEDAEATLNALREQRATEEARKVPQEDIDAAYNLYTDLYAKQAQAEADVKARKDAIRLRDKNRILVEELQSQLDAIPAIEVVEDEAAGDEPPPDMVQMRADKMKEVADLELSLSSLKHQIEIDNANRKSRSDVERSIEIVEHQASIAKVVMDTCTKISALVIDEMAPEIERVAGDILVAAGLPRISVVTQESTGKAVRETFEIQFHLPEGTLPISNLGGGYQYLIGLALRTAFIVAVCREADLNVKTVFIQEGTGALDKDNLAKFPEVLKAMRKAIGGNLILSTHQGIMAPEGTKA